MATYACATGLTIGTGSKLFVESNVYDIRAGAAGDALSSTAAYWTPAQDYPYSVDEVNTVRAKVQAQAGAGKVF